MGLLLALLDLVFPGRRYGRPAVTKRGVAVRSRAEQRIAEYFEGIGLRYQYEKELQARFWIFTETICKPDFYLPDYDVYVEYWGMLNVANDYDRAKYAREMKYKLARYHELDVKFISLYPDNLPNLDGVFRKRFRELTGEELTGKGSRQQAE